MGAVSVLAVAVVSLTNRLRTTVPFWAFVVFFAGVGATTLYALFVSGMALYNDWI